MPKTCDNISYLKLHSIFSKGDKLNSWQTKRPMETKS